MYLQESVGKYMEGKYIPDYHTRRNYLWLRAILTRCWEILLLVRPLLETNVR